MEGFGVRQASFLVILSIVIFPNLTSGYQVFWNVPTEICLRNFNMSFQYIAKDYGITINQNDKFQGDAVTIMYAPGLFPEIKGYQYDPSLKVPDLSTLEFINGGLPQDGVMIDHLDAFELAVNKSVPDPKNKGLIIIDMEIFGATWAQNFGTMMIYRILSRKRVQDKNPTWPTAKVEAQAILEYERAATKFIIKTIQYGKAMRPYAKWGYYQYPQCFNQPGIDYCSNTTQEDNNQMILLWKASDALYPSSYLLNTGTPDQRAQQVTGQVREAKRVLKSVNNTGLVYPYIWYRYFGESGFILDADLENVISIPKQEGADGVVLWGSSYDFTKVEGCKSFNDYVKKSVGPIAKKYISK